MSLNKFTDTNIKKWMKINCADIKCDNILGGNISVTTSDGVVNYLTPNKGFNDFTLHTDGNGGTFWAPAASNLFDQGLNTVDEATFAGLTLNNDEILLGNVGVPTGSSNIVLGSDQSGNNINNGNVIMGVGSGKNYGSNNVILGTNAGTGGSNKDACVIIGNGAGLNSGFASCAIGNLSGFFNQSAGCVALGDESGSVSQGIDSVAVGKSAGKTNQGQNAVSMGANAGTTNQHTNSICINADASVLNTTATDQIKIKAGTTLLTYDATGLDITNATESVSLATGSIRTSGGLAVTKNLRVGGDMVINTPSSSYNLKTTNNAYANSHISSDGTNTKWVNNDLSIIINTEADLIALKPLVGGEHALDAKTYIFNNGTIPFFNPIRIPTGSGAKIRSSSSLNILVYLGSGAFIRGTNCQFLLINDITLASVTGTNSLFDMVGDPLLRSPSRNIMTMRNCTLSGFVEMGNYTNSAAFSVSNTFFNSIGTLTLDNTSVSISNCIFLNGTPTADALFLFKNNLAYSTFNALGIIEYNKQSLFNVEPNIISRNGGLHITETNYDGIVKRSITSFVDMGGGNVQVSYVGSINPIFTDGDVVAISESTDYDATYTITGAGTNVFIITAVFTTNTAYGVVTLMDGATPYFQPMFVPSTKSGNITAYADNGAGGTTVSSAGHTLINGDLISLKDDKFGDYDTGCEINKFGYIVFNVVAGSSFDIPVVFVGNDARGTFNNASLDQESIYVSSTDNRLIPNSQLLSSLVSITPLNIQYNLDILTRIGSGLDSQGNIAAVPVYSLSPNESFKQTFDGNMIYVADVSAIFGVSCRIVAQKVSGTGVACSINIMVNDVEISKPRSNERVLSSDPVSLIISTTIYKLKQYDKIAVGFACEEASLTNITLLKMDINIFRIG